MAVGAAAVTVFLLISIGMGLFSGRGNSGAAAEAFSGRAAELWILIILAWTAAIGEEFFFRAWIQDTAEQLNLTPAAGLAVSCAAFAFIHLWQGLNVMIYSAFIGLLYSLWYHRKHSLWVPVISHGLHNTLVFLLAFRSQFEKVLLCVF